MQQFSKLSTDDPKTYELIDAYINSLSFEDRLYALQYGSSLAESQMAQAFQRWR
jgi:hypothetical protein